MGILSHVIRSIKGDFFSPAGYFFVGWIITYVLIGIFVYFLEERQAGRRSLIDVTEGLKFCFPKEKLAGPSAKLDFKIFFFNHYVFYFLVFLIWGGSAWENKIATHVATSVSILGVHIPASNGVWADFIYTVFVLFVADLGWTIQHILFHKVGWLWEFHKVHHSAKELNIFTIARLHPLDALSQGWASAVAVGIFMGLVRAFLGYQPSLVLFMNVSVAMAVFRIFGIFRHSHIWISFGPVLSRVVCSPAMHQIHHSVEERHWDRNFSTVFSFWDWVFGTLYIPKEKENFQLGIEPHPSRNYNTFWGCLIDPLLPSRSKLRK